MLNDASLILETAKRNTVMRDVTNRAVANNWYPRVRAHLEKMHFNISGAHSSIPGISAPSNGLVREKEKCLEVGV